MKYKHNRPIRVKKTEIQNAVWVVISLAGRGLFLVLSIKISLSFSIIWLKEFDAPTMEYPPTTNKISSLKSTTSTARKYPAMDEKTTLRANLALVKEIRILALINLNK